MPTQEQVYEALKEVEDPELHMGIVDLGLVYGVDIEGPASENVTVTMTLTSPMCPVGPMFKESVETKVRSMEGVAKANVEITFQEGSLPTNPGWVEHCRGRPGKAGAPATDRSVARTTRASARAGWGRDE